MPRLGGSSQQSYLVDSSGSLTQTATTSSMPPSIPRGGDIARVHSAGSPSSTGTDPRARTYSTPTLRRTQTESTCSSGHSESSLRRRSRLYDSDASSPIMSRQSSSPTSYMIHSPSSSPRRPPQPRRLGNIIQAVVVLCVLCLVWDSNRKVDRATQQLLRYQKEESHLIAQMERVEGRADILRAKVSAFKEEEQSGKVVEPALKSMHLQQELAHLTHEDEVVQEELKTLKARVQRSARDSIANMYGQGIVRVTMHLIFSDGPGDVVLEMSQETPHAVWVWLQQIVRHDWDDAMFRWKLEHVILATPARLSRQNYNLEFIEENQELNHVEYSVGLSPREDSGVNFYINLMDNGPYHASDVCIGKVVGGFDVLKKLLNIPIHEETKHLDPAVSIRSVTVSTVQPEAATK